MKTKLIEGTLVIDQMVLKVFNEMEILRVEIDRSTKVDMILRSCQIPLGS